MVDRTDSFVSATGLPVSSAATLGGTPMGALTRVPGTVGVAAPNPVAPVGSNPGFFLHTGGNSPANAPGRFGAGVASPSPAFAETVSGLRAAAAQAPSPDEPETVVDFIPGSGETQHAKINKRLQHDMMPTSQKDFLVWTEKQGMDPNLARTGAETRRYCQLAPQGVNWVLACSSKPADDWESVDDATAVLDLFGYEGVVTTDSGGRNQYQPNGGQEERTLNVRSSGKAFTHNVWGNGVQAGDQLYAVIKREDISKVDIRVDPQGGPLPLPKEQISPRPFQISFTHTRGGPPPQSALMYVDEFGQKCYGKAIRLGVAANNPVSRCNPDDLEAARHDIARMVALPKIEVWVTVLN